MHGRKSNLTEDFLDELKNNDVDILICEGTNLSDSREVPNKRRTRPHMIDHGCWTEAEVESEVRKVAEDSEGLAMVETSHVDVDRVRSSWRAAEKALREFVMGPKTAYATYMAKSRVGIEELPIPENCSLWLHRHKDEGVDTRLLDEWDVRKKGRSIRPDQFLVDENFKNVYWGEQREEIRKNPSEYIICTSNATKTLLELYTNSKRFSCEFVLGKSEPFTEETRISFNKLLSWLELLGVGEYHQIHVSGHCDRRDLEKTIKTANPRILIPVHTENPKAFKEIHDDTRLVEKGGKVSF